MIGQPMPPPSAPDLAAHADFLRRLAASLMRSPDLAEDAVQETLLLSLRRPPAAGAAPRGWLVGLLRNVVRNLRRGEARRAARERRAAPPSRAQPELLREREGLRARLVAAVLALPDPLREVLLLRYDAGLPPREVARLTGRPVATVHDRLARGLSLLRARLGDQEPPGDPAERRRSLRAGLAALGEGASQAAPLGLAGAGLALGKPLLAVGTALLLVAGAWWAAADRPRPSPPAATGGPLPAEARAGSPSLARAAPTLAGGAPEGPAAALPREPGVFGAVVASVGARPVAGARVVAWRLAPPGPFGEAPTDLEGAFALSGADAAVGPLHLVVTHPGFAPARLERVHPGLEPLRAELEPAAFLVGRLVFPSPAHPAFAGARLLARSQPPRPMGEASDALTGDLRPTFPEHVGLDAQTPASEGGFRLGPLRAGTYALVLSCEGLAPLELGGAASHDPGSGVAVPMGATVDLGELRVPPVEPVRVRVLDAGTEQPLLRAAFFGVHEHVQRVVLTTALEALPGDPPGTYLVPCFRGSAALNATHLRVTAPGYGPLDAAWVNHFSDEPHVVRLHAAAAVEGVVADADGRPLADALVIVRTASDELARAWAAADARGAFRFEGLPALTELQVLAISPGAADVHALAGVRLEPGRTARLNLGGPGATALEGRLTRAGLPVAGVLVSLLGPEGRRLQLETRATGRFAFAGLEPGTRRLFLALGPGAGSLEAACAVEEGRTTQVEIGLAPPVPGRVAFTGLGGDPVERPSADGPLHVVARGTGPDGRRWTVEAPVEPGGAGGFLLSLPSGGGSSWSLSVEEEHALTLAPLVAVLPPPPGAAPLVLPVVIDPRDGSYEILALDAESGAPVPRATFEGGWREVASAGTLGADATLRGTGASLAEHVFRLHGPRHVSAEVRFTLTPTDRHVRLELRLARAEAVRIVAVEAPGAAAEAGVRAGDLLVRHGARPVTCVEELAAAVAATRPEEPVELELVREGSPLTLRARGGRLGVRLVNARR